MFGIEIKQLWLKNYNTEAFAVMAWKLRYLILTLIWWKTYNIFNILLKIIIQKSYLLYITTFIL